MALLSAKQLRARETEPFLVSVDGGEVRVRRPDLEMMVLRGLVNLPLLNDVLKLVSDWVGAPALDNVPENVIEHSQKMIAFLDQFVCAAMLEPRAVMTPADVVDEDKDIVVSDLTVSFKKQIVVAVGLRIAAAQKGVVAAAADFPQRESGDGTRPDVPEVSPAAV